MNLQGAHRPQWQRYAIAVFAVAAAVGVRAGLLEALGTRVVYVTFFPAVTIAALFGGLSAGLLATVLSAGAATMWIEPVGRLLAVRDPADWLGIAVFLMSCTMISGICEAMHRAQARAAEAEAKAEVADERARTESALRQSEAKYRFISENTGDVIWLFDLQSNKFTYVSASVRRVSGYAPEEVVGQALEVWLTPESMRLVQERLTRRIAALEAGDESVRIQTHEVDQRHKDGSVVPTESVTTLLQNEAGRVTQIIGAAREITERRRAHIEMRESEERYRSLFENLLNGFAYCRMFFDDGRPQDFIYLAVNRAFEALTGLKNVTGRMVSEVIPGIRQTDPELFEIYGRVAMTGIPERFETYVKALEMWFEISVYSPQREHFVAVFDVITERKRSEQKLRESEERLKLALSASKMGVWEWNIQSNAVFWSPEWYEIAGADNLDLTFDSFAKLLHPEDASRVMACINRAISTRSVYEAEFRIVRPGGSVIWISNLGKADYDESGQPLRMVGIVRDITELKEAEHALRESERRHRRLFEEATEGIALADAETGEILDCNRAFSQLSGYDRLDLIGKPQTVLHPKEEGNSSVSRTFAQHRDKKDGAILAAEFVTRSGTVKQVEIKANVLEIGGRKVLQGFFRDVTEELRFHHERETTLKLLHLLNDHNNTHELIRSLTGFLQEWTGCEAVGVRLQNGEDFPYFETRGFPREFVQAENYLCLRDDEGRVRHDSQGNPVLECMCGNILCGRFNPALPFFTPKGSFWTNCTTDLLAATSEADRQARTRNRCNGEGYESVALFALRHGASTLGLLQINDRARNRFTPELITFLENAADQIAIALAQRQAQEALRESEERYRALVENANEVIAVLQEGMLRFVNPEAEVLSGYCREELTTRPFSEFVHPEDCTRVAAFYQHGLRGDPALKGDEIRILRKDGAVRWVNVKATRILWRGAPATLNLYTDVTEQKRAKQDKEKLEAQFFQAQKMESIGRLAGGVAHDFNNMLSVIIGSAQLAMSEVDPAGPLYGELQEIQNAGQRSADLTRQLLAFARRQTVSPKILDLNETIEGMLKMLRRLIGEDIHLSWNPGHDLWRVKIDPSQIDQILANLVVNARDAIVGVGQVVISTGNVAIDASYCSDHIGFLPGEYTVLTISDNGIGMHKDVLDHIFEPFFTTKEMGKGTGLGLSTVYGIVKQNNGFIDVSSEPGKGTTFRVFLPRIEVPTEQAPGGEAATRVPGGKETLLLVEDSRPLLDLGRKILERLGYTVLAAATPQAALDIARTHAGKIHLLITDVVMPEMNGRELMEEITAIRSDTKCLFMSGYAADVIAHQHVLGAGVHLIQKPFKTEEFAAMIREVLEST